MVVDRATDGHCDCAFWINYYRWCWPDLGALIAPQALLIASGTETSCGGPTPSATSPTASATSTPRWVRPSNSTWSKTSRLTAIRPKLRHAIFTWFNTHLKGDSTPVEDDVTDFVEPEENLLVFGGQLPETTRCGGSTRCWSSGRSCRR